MREPLSGRGGRVLVDLLALTTVGVYLLLVVGVSTAILDGAATCSTWPACGDRWLVPADASFSLVVAWLHRFVALLVGVLLAVTAGAAWRPRSRTPRRVRVALAAALSCYPIQVAIGALTAVGGASVVLSATHLVLAMGIFSTLLLALLWQLEAETPTGETAGTVGTAGRAEPTGTAGRFEAIGTTGTAGTTDEPAAAGPSRPGRRDQSEPGAAGPEGSGGTSGALSPTGLGDLIGAYVELTKPKLWWLLCLVALAAMGLAGGRTLHLPTVVATLAGGVLAIGASGTFNNVLERDVDRRMARTDDRPLVEGRVPVRNAVGFGLALTISSVVVFVAFVNVLAAALGLLAILFYSVGYTLVLKPNTTQNIVLGGAVGAFPALIGWAAVTESVGLPAVVLGAVIFLWTPAHFYNLAMAYRDDYARAGFPMLPVVRGDAVTRRHVLLYLGATMLAAIALGADPRLDLAYAVTVAAVGGIFVLAVVGLFRQRDRAAAFRAFHASNAYLGCLLVAVVLDTLVL